MVVSSMRAPATDRRRMTGPAGPAQTDDETTSTPSAMDGSVGDGAAPSATDDGVGRTDGVSGSCGRPDRSPRDRRHGDVSEDRRHRLGRGPEREPGTDHAGRVDEQDVGRVRHRVGAGRRRSRRARSARPTRRLSPGSARSFPVSAMKPAGMNRTYSRSQAVVSRSGSTLTKTARGPDPKASIASPTVPMVAGHTSGQWVYPKNTSAGAPRNDAREKGASFASISSIAAAGRGCGSRYDAMSTGADGVARALPPSAAPGAAPRGVRLPDSALAPRKIASTDRQHERRVGRPGRGTSSRGPGSVGRRLLRHVRPAGSPP